MQSFESDSQLIQSLQDVLRSAIEIADADFGNIQLLDPETSCLKIVVHQGFEKEWIDYWDRVSHGHGVCGTALERGERVIVEDIKQSPIFQGTVALEVQRKAGVRAVQSTPILGRSDQLLGMFSTHYRHPGRPSDRTLRILDLFARQAGDIIELHRSKEALRESEELLRRVSDNASVGLTRCSRDWYYVSANPAYAKIAGKPIEQIVGRPIAEVMGSRAADTIRPFVERVLNGEHVSYEAQVPFAGSGLRYLHVSYTPDFDSAGRIVGWVACVVDVTDIAVLKRMEDELRAAIEVRDDFISVASHELKTPLTALYMQLDLLNRFVGTAGQGPQSKISGLARSAYQSVKVFSELLDDLLDVTRIRVGKLTLSLQEMDLREAVLEHVKFVREAALERGSNIAVQANEPVRGTWDSKRINQILSNLLSNAIKYGSGNPIEVRLSTNIGTETARIEVQDHGIGIPKEMQTKIFERFQRAVSDKTITGLGLGLYIVRQIVELHGGSIAVASEIGQGALFTVLLPLRPPQSQTWQSKEVR